MDDCLVDGERFDPKGVFAVRRSVTDIAHALAILDAETASRAVLAGRFFGEGRIADVEGFIAFADADAARGASFARGLALDRGIVAASTKPNRHRRDGDKNQKEFTFH